MQININDNVTRAIIWTVTAITIIIGLVTTKNAICLWGLFAPVIIEIFTI
jgi:hypothetical protein